MEQPENELHALMLTRQELIDTEIAVLRDIQRLKADYRKLSELTNSRNAELSESRELYTLSGILAKIQAALNGIGRE